MQCTYFVCVTLEATLNNNDHLFHQNNGCSVNSKSVKKTNKLSEKDNKYTLK